MKLYLIKKSVYLYVFLLVVFDQVKNHFVHEFPVFEDGTKGNWVKSGLEMDSEVNSFRGGRLKLKCIASVFSVHHRSSEQQIEEEKPRSASVKAGSKDSSGNQVGLHNTGQHGFALCLPTCITFQQYKSRINKHGSTINYIFSHVYIHFLLHTSFS